MENRLNNLIKIFTDDVQKKIEELDNQINKNCLVLYNEFKTQLEEAYLEGIIEYETALMNYNMKLDEMNSKLQKELDSLYDNSVPVKVISLSEIYFHDKVC